MNYNTLPARFTVTPLALLVPIASLALVSAFASAEDITVNSSGLFLVYQDEGIENIIVPSASEIFSNNEFSFISIVESRASSIANEGHIIGKKTISVEDRGDVAQDGVVVTTVGSIANSGTISVLSGSTTGSFGISIDDGAQVGIIANSGTILANDGEFIGIGSIGIEVFNRATVDSITNEGTIKVASGIVVSDIGSAVEDITNSGTISMFGSNPTPSGSSSFGISIDKMAQVGSITNTGTISCVTSNECENRNSIEVRNGAIVNSITNEGELDFAKIEVSDFGTTV